MNDVNRLRILQDVIDRRLTTRLAASRLEISDRHCRNMHGLHGDHRCPGVVVFESFCRASFCAAGQPVQAPLSVPRLKPLATRLCNLAEQSNCQYEQAGHTGTGSTGNEVARNNL